MGEGVGGTGGDSVCVVGQRQLPRLPAVMALGGKQLQEGRLEGGGEGGGRVSGRGSGWNWRGQCLCRWPETAAAVAGGDGSRREAAPGRTAGGRGRGRREREEREREEGEREEGRGRRGEGGGEEGGG